MQTILGAGGTVANNLAKYKKEIRLVSQNPKKANPVDEAFPADLLNPDTLLNYYCKE